jgi:hypothetical protein
MGCDSNTLYTEFAQCVAQHDCFGGQPDGGSSCSPEACLAAIAMYPANCAEASCENGNCVIRAKDADGDGQRTKFCKDTSGVALIEIGTDCDDGNPTQYAGAWDGPGGDGQEDRCDGIDQSCSGTADDDVLANGVSCACSPGAIEQCSATAGGKPITWPNGVPEGECAYGSRECEQDAATGGGRWGPCIGAVEAALEECNGKDDDCDGETDEEAVDPIEWTCDRDNDGHFAPTATQVASCAQPQSPCAGTWRTDGPLDDCNDGDAAAYKGAPELCDGVDNDCNGQVDDNPVNPTTWYLDADNDKHGDANTPPTVACNRPTASWKTYDTLNGNASNDCNDGEFKINPGRWDGPEKSVRAYGIDPPGWTTEIFKLQVPASCDYGCTQQAAGAALQSGTPVVTRNDLVIDFHWNESSPDPAVPELTDFFAVRWSGKLTAPTTGAYTFSASVNNGIRIKLDGVIILDGWGGQTSSVESSPLQLQAGVKHDIVVEYYERAEFAYLLVLWEGPGFGGTTGIRARQNPVGGNGADSCDNVDNDCSGLADDAVARDVDMPSVAYGCIKTPDDCDPYAWGAARLNRDCMAPNPAPPPGTPCHGGVQTCRLSGNWTPCAGWIHAQPFDTCDNHIDDDCNGVVDDSSANAAWYYDGDKDGYRCNGSSCPASIAACGDPGDTWVQWKTGDPVDCDDTTNLKAPNRAEVCDGKDNNCDGSIDNNAVDGKAYYPDSDGDGRGRSTAAANIRCTHPGAGWVENQDDCDDTKKVIYLGAPERCDGVDNNCNGQTDENSVCTGCLDLPSSIAVTASTPVAGDFEFNGHGPNMYAKITTKTQGLALQVSMDLVARETTSDWTTGKGSASALTSSFPLQHTVCSICRPNGFGCTWVNDGTLWTGSTSVAGVSGLNLLYTDTNGSTVDYPASPMHTLWSSQFTCYGDTSGDDICYGSDCTRCTVAFQGCLPVQYCQLPVN